MGVVSEHIVRHTARASRAPGRPSGAISYGCASIEVTPIQGSAESQDGLASQSILQFHPATAASRTVAISWLTKSKASENRSGRPTVRKTNRSLSSRMVSS